MLKAYIDGSCINHTGEGGWGVVLFGLGKRKSYQGRVSRTNNNRMELTAAIEVLSRLPAHSTITIYSDSMYVVSRKPCEADLDLWTVLGILSEGHTIDYQWVKGHADCQFNKRADRLARYKIKL